MEGGESDSPLMVASPVLDPDPGNKDTDAAPFKPAALPVMVAVVGSLEGDVTTTNSPLVCPSGITAMLATFARGLSDVSETGIPPAGAGVGNVTRPVTGPPAI